MAKAIVKKSRQGKDLVVATFGPKETAVVIAALQAFTEEKNAKNVRDTLAGARMLMTGRKVYAQVVTEAPTIVVAKNGTSKMTFIS